MYLAFHVRDVGAAAESCTTFSKDTDIFSYFIVLYVATYLHAHGISLYNQAALALSKQPIVGGRGATAMSAATFGELSSS